MPTNIPGTDLVFPGNPISNAYTAYKFAKGGGFKGVAKSLSGLTGTNIPRNISVPKFDFGSPGGAYAPFAELGKANIFLARDHKIPSYRSVSTFLAPRQEAVWSFANRVHSDLEAAGSVDDAAALRSVMTKASSGSSSSVSPTTAITQEFTHLQALWNASLAGGELVEESVGDLSEQDRAVFNNRRNYLIASELQPKVQKQLTENNNIVTTQQSTEGGDLEVTGEINQFGEEEVFIASEQPFHTIGPDNQIRMNSLDPLTKLNASFDNTLSGAGGLTEGPLPFDPQGKTNLGVPPVVPITGGGGSSGNGVTMIGTGPTAPGTTEIGTGPTPPEETGVDPLEVVGDLGFLRNLFKIPIKLPEFDEMPQLNIGGIPAPRNIPRDIGMPELSGFLGFTSFGSQPQPEEADLGFFSQEQLRPLSSSDALPDFQPTRGNIFSAKQKPLRGLAFLS